MTETKLNAVKMAMAAYQAAEKENAERLQEADANRLAQAVKRFEEFFGCASESGGITDDHKKAWFLSGDYKFYFQFGDDHGWQVEGTCPVCGMEVPSPMTNSLEMLGRYLAHFQPEYEHKDVCVAPLERFHITVQTADQDLLQALKDVIHNEIVEELGR